jgi:hypothetical protein
MTGVVYVFTRVRAVALLAAGMALAPAAASAFGVSGSYVTGRTDRVANWQSAHWDVRASGPIAYTCGDVTNSHSGVYVYYALVRDIQLLPDQEIAKRGSYGWDPKVCSGRAAIVRGNAYYTRIFTNVELIGSHGVWAQAEK